MSTNFPTTLDDATSIPAEGASTPLSTNHVTAHQNLQDAVEAIEAKVGVNSSAVTTTHDYKLSGVTGSDKAVSKTGSEVLTNKTLTSPKITVGSDAVGDLHYTSNVDGTQSRLAIGSDNYILKVNGSSINWEAETTTVDASTTVKGVVEAATAAEVTAGTATGGTGAVLAVTPDALASSTPVFNGSGITGIPRKVDITTSNTTVTGTTTETTIYSVSIPANTLSTNNGILGKIAFDWRTNTNAAKTIKMKYGSTTIATFTATPNTTTDLIFPGEIDFRLLANAATNAQEGSFSIVGTIQEFYPTSATNNYIHGFVNGSSAEDSTGALNLVFTVTQGNGGNETFTMKHAYTQTLK